MNYYKVEITQSETFIIDARAKTEEQAKKIAAKKWKEICENGTYHYQQFGDTETKITHVFDVTGTEDAV